MANSFFKLYVFPSKENSYSFLIHSNNIVLWQIKKEETYYFGNYRANASSYKQAYHFQLDILKETFISNSQNYVCASLGIAEFLSLEVFLSGLDKH